MFLTRRTLLGLGLTLALSPRLTQAQALLPKAKGTLNVAAPVNATHPLARGLVGWWRNVDGLRAGSLWYDLTRHRPGVLTGMGTNPPRITGGSGWGKSSEKGHDGQMRFDGTNDYLDLGTSPDLNILGPMTFFCHMVPQEGPSGSGGCLIAAAEGTTVKAYGFGVFENNTSALKVSWGSTAIAVTSNIMQTNVGVYCGFIRDGVPGNWTCTIWWQDGIPALVTGITTNPQSFNTGHVAVGGHSTLVVPGYFQGNMDDVMLWNRALRPVHLRHLHQESRLGWPTLLRRLPLEAFPTPSPSPTKSRSVIF